jgi:hypothetical protein
VVTTADNAAHNSIMELRSSRKRKLIDIQEAIHPSDGAINESESTARAQPRTTPSSTQQREFETPKFFSPDNAKFPYDLVYKPLRGSDAPNDGNESDFRVVCLLPGTGDDIIRCELLPEKLSTATYEAISYCAGSAHDYKTIFLNGFPFNTFRSTYEALKRFRKSHEPRVLWVDQICINQANIAERDSQVLLMRDIYQRAARTHVWLGEAASDPSSDAAFRLLRDFASVNGKALREQIEEIGTTKTVHTDARGRLQRTILPSDRTTDPLQYYLNTEHNWSFHFSPPDPLVRSERAKVWREDPTFKSFRAWFHEASEKEAYKSSWLALSELYKRPWWKRCWIVQEVVASGELHLVCGSNSMPWEELSRFLDTYTILFGRLWENDTWSNGQIEMLLNPCTATHAFINSIRRVPHPLDLYGLMAQLRESIASDPRDKLYAVLGMLPDSGRKYMIHPNYASSNTTRDVYLAAARTILTVDKVMELILHVTGHEVDVGLPSWAPDWSSIGNRVQEHSYSSYQAGTSRETQCTISEDGRRLRVRGWLVDGVETLGPADEGVGCDFPAILETWRSMFVPAQTDNGDTLHRLDKFYRTIGLEKWTSEGSEIDPDGDAEKFHKDWNETMQNWCKSDDRVSIGCRFFVSKAGRPGMVGPKAEISDAIFIPWGSPMPVILRRNEASEYRVVCPCYLHDMMYHEIRVEEWQKTVRDEEICII